MYTCVDQKKKLLRHPPKKKTSKKKKFFLMQTKIKKKNVIQKKKKKIAMNQVDKPTFVVVSALQLQRYFKACDAVKHDTEFAEIYNTLLTHVPNRCNYRFDPSTMVADVDDWIKLQKTLAFQLSLTFTVGCQIEVTSFFYDQLSFLGEAKRILCGWEKRPARPSQQSTNQTFALSTTLWNFFVGREPVSSVKKNQ